MRNRVLILEAEMVQTLIIAECLYKSGYIVVLSCAGKENYGYHTKYASERLLAPSVGDEKEYLRHIKESVSKYGIDVLIPMSDDSACIISKYKTELSNICNFLMPKWEIFQKAYNKNLLMGLCKEYGFPHPKSIDLSKVDYKNITDNDINFPALIKPNYTSGGRGMTLVCSVQDFIFKYPNIYEQYGECHLQEFIKPGGKQIKVQIFIDPKTRKYYSSVIYKQRYYPENGGSSCCNVTIKNDELVKLCHSILEIIGWEGFADFDLIEDPKDGIFKIMEINPRIPACIKSAIKSGIDYASLIVDASLGKELQTYNYEPGKKLRHIGFEILWFIYSKNRFRTKPNWFNFFEKGLSFQDFSWKDPLPFFWGTYGNIKKQLNPKFRKEKSGLR